MGWSVLVVGGGSHAGPQRRVPAEGGSDQVVDLLARGAAGQTVIELQLDEADEEGVQRPARGQQLLRDLGEGPMGADHAGQRRDLAARPLDVPDDRLPFVWNRGHGDTKAAPVIPKAA